MFLQFVYFLQYKIPLPASLSVPERLSLNLQSRAGPGGVRPRLGGVGGGGRRLSGGAAV